MSTAKIQNILLFDDVKYAIYVYYTFQSKICMASSPAYLVLRIKLKMYYYVQNNNTYYKYSNKDAKILQ